MKLELYIIWQKEFLIEMLCCVALYNTDSSYCHDCTVLNNPVTDFIESELQQVAKQERQTMGKNVSKL